MDNNTPIPTPHVGPEDRRPVTFEEGQTFLKLIQDLNNRLGQLEAVLPSITLEIQELQQVVNELTQKAKGN